MSAYHMLVCSLPALPPHFKTDRLPISRERLMDRLRMLRPFDAAQLRAAMEVLQWGRQFEEADDAAVARRFEVLHARVSNPLLHDVLGEIVCGRAIMAALRRRLRGWGPPVVALGWCADRLRRNFTKPDFGLGPACPWIAAADQGLREGSLRKVHELLLEVLWSSLRRRAEAYTFEFEAVALYVARWTVVARWRQLEPELGRRKFEELVQEVLGEHAQIHA